MFLNRSCYLQFTFFIKLNNDWKNNCSLFFYFRLEKMFTYNILRCLMTKNVREEGGAVVINDEKELNGLHGELAGRQITDLIFGLKIYRELLLYNI